MKVRKPDRDESAGQTFADAGVRATQTRSASRVRPTRLVTSYDIHARYRRSTKHAQTHIRCRAAGNRSRTVARHWIAPSSDGNSGRDLLGQQPERLDVSSVLRLADEVLDASIDHRLVVRSH